MPYPVKGRTFFCSKKGGSQINGRISWKRFPKQTSFRNRIFLNIPFGKQFIPFWDLLMHGSNLREMKIASDPTQPTQVMKCYEQFSNFRDPQLPLGTHQSCSKVKIVKKPNSKVKAVQLRERKNFGGRYEIKALRQSVQPEGGRSNTVH